MNIYDFQFRWRFTRTGLRLLRGGEVIADMVPSLEVGWDLSTPQGGCYANPHGSLSEIVQMAELILLEKKKVPRGANFDHFALPRAS